MISYNIELNIKQPGAVDTGIELTQGDYGNVEFLMRVKEDDAYIMNASSAEVVFNLPNGYIVNGPVSINSGTYSYTIRGNELQSAGKISAVLTLTYVNGRTSSCGFIFNCRYNPLYDRGIKAGPYITQLEAIMIQAQEQVNYLDALIKSIQGSVGGVVLTRNDVTNQIINDANKVASMAALYSVDQKVDQVNSNIANRGFYLDNLNDIPYVSNIMTVYRASPECANNPTKAYGIVKTLYIDAGDYAIQEFTAMDATNSFSVRTKLNGIWGDWIEK